MKGNYVNYKKKLESKPFGIFGGSPDNRKNVHTFDIPLKKLSENKPLLD